MNQETPDAGTVTVPREMFAALVDMAVGTSDWGSGFLDSEEVEILRTAAGVLDIPARDVTPDNFLSEYADPLSEKEFKNLALFRLWVARGESTGPYYVKVIADLERRMAANGQTEPAGESA